MTARASNLGLVLAGLVSFAGLASLSAFATGCTGSAVPWTFEDEPVCADFKVGASTEVSRGGLKKPLRATFKSGKDVVARVVIYGLRQKSDPATPLLLADSDAEYDVEWAECENERAPMVVSKNKPFDTKYECGEAKPYANLKVQTKGGQNPRKLAVTLPPASPCWEADKHDAPAPSAVAPPDPPPAATPEASASTAPSASAAASAAPKASASSKAQPAKP